MEFSDNYFMVQALKGKFLLSTSKALLSANSLPCFFTHSSFFPHVMSNKSSI